MKTAKLKGIHILLKKIPVSYAMNYVDTDFCKNEGKDIFIREFLKQYQMYSEDEVNKIYDLIMGNSISFPLAVFELIKEIAEEYLYMNGKNLFCYRNKILEFREVAIGIGQSLFISAYLAARKNKLGIINIPLQDTLIVQSDDLRLKHILNNGIADNHFHLNGSAPTALLSWICLMNYPAKRNKEFCAFNERRNFFSRPDEDQGNSLQNDIIIASAIRLMMYYAMNELLEEAEKVIKWLDLYLMGLESVDGLQLLIDSERTFMPNDSLDYIQFSINKNSVFFPIAGEQEFLIKAFTLIWSNKINVQKWENKIYTYLLIFCRFYSEMVQSNETVGFYNFMRYQDRKEVFLEAYPRYSFQVKKMALELALKPDNLISLEARIAPKFTCEALIAQQRLFIEKIFVCDERRCLGCSYYNPILEQCSKEQCVKIFERLFFVYHFVKVPDVVAENFEVGINAADFKFRHYDLRKKNIWPIIWKFNRLRKENSIFDNVYGLDACNREIGCRPEVFAPYFRFAREQDTYLENDLFGERKLPKIKITYHVGEDFLDILDGLRAIEEAITFMELKSGDRLGHALALGVDVKTWYTQKEMKIYLDRQDFLDNTVFLYNMLLVHQINYPILQQNLKNDFYKNLKIIYPDLQEASISEYILSMQLRGDEPGIYLKWEQLLDNDAIEEDWKKLDTDLAREARRSEMAVKLYYQYHYDQRAKYEGRKSIEQNITEEYINAVAEVQEIICNKVARLGIGIECNPSSNISIGMTKNYIDHPILRFNHYNLNGMIDNGMPEMFVSINTDDLGVFDTNLENEFALMVCALQQEKDENGKLKFQLEEIYRWINNIRRMGLEQSFKLSEKKERKKIYVED